MVAAKRPFWMPLLPGYPHCCVTCLLQIKDFPGLESRTPIFELSLYLNEATNNAGEPQTTLRLLSKLCLEWNGTIGVVQQRINNKPAKSDKQIYQTTQKAFLRALKQILPNYYPFFAYYGAQRGRIEIPERLRPSNQEYNHPTSALVGALDSQSDFKELLKWFDIEEATELRANKGCRPEEFELSIALETVRNAIESIFANKYRNPYFNRDHKFVVEQENGMPLQVLQLSQGYQSMLALVMDFARRLAIGNSHLTFDSLLHSPIRQSLFDFNVSEFPENFRSPSLLAPGVMLIDEIDLNLHPSWQQRVIGDLMRTFPNTQFIVTTHSPQVLTTVPAKCLRLLQIETDTDTGKTQVRINLIKSETLGTASIDTLAKVMGTDPIPDSNFHYGQKPTQIPT